MSHPSITINGRTFYVRRFEPFPALRVLGDLQKHILAPLAAGMEGAQPADLAGALGKLSDGLDGATLERLARLLLNKDYVSVEGEDGTPRRLDDGALNMALGGVGDLLELCVFAARVNFEDVLGKFMGQAMAALPSLSGAASGSPTS